MSVDWRKNTDFKHKGIQNIYFACAVAFLNSAINGYDLSLIGGLLVLPPFLTSFNGGDKNWDPNVKALLVAILQIGSVIGCLFVGLVCDMFGRKVGMQVGSLIIIVGTVIELVGGSTTLFMVGRFMIGFGVVFVTTAGPTYCVEVAHPQFRGKAGAFYNTGWSVGSIPASLVLFGMAYVDTDTAWRLPCGLQAMFSGFVLIGCFFIPESPRWLASKGRAEDVRKFLTHYWGNDDANHPIIEFTLGEINAALEEEKAQNQGSYLAFFQSKPMLHRTFIIFCVAFFSQYAGNWLAGYFLPTVEEYFGITSTSQQLGFNVVTGVISFIASQFGTLNVDRLGRRTMLLYGSLAFTIWYALIIIGLAIYGDDPAKIGWAIFSFIALQLFAITYGFCWTPLNALYPVEILPYSARAKGMALCQLVINLASVIQAYVLSNGLETWKYKFFTFYLAFNALATVTIYFFFPETKGLTLEGINSLFEHGNPVKNSLKPIEPVSEKAAVV